MKKYLVISACVCFSCNPSSPRKNQIIASQTGKKALTSKMVEIIKDKYNLRYKIRGTWTDGSTDNASFDIQADSIFYTDNLKFYKYTLNNSALKIYLDGYTYRGKIDFKGDTLVIISKDGEASKFWRFKD